MNTKNCLVLAAAAALVFGVHGRAEKFHTPYRPIAFDESGVARFEAQAEDILVVYRTGELVRWPDYNSAPPYAPVAVSPASGLRLGTPAARGAALARSVPGASVAGRSGRAVQSLAAVGGEPLPQWSVGDTNELQGVAFILRAISQHGYLWVESSLPAPDELLQAVGAQFDRVYETIVPKYGPPTDVDGDPRIHLFSGLWQTSFFSDMLLDSEGLDIIGITATKAEDMDALAQSMAHELVHDIWWAAKQQHGLFVIEEGLTTYAEFLVSTKPNANYYNFLKYPPGGSLILNSYSIGYTYGVGMLFIAYLVDSFGDTVLRDLTSGSELAGGDSLEWTTGYTPEELLVEWAAGLLLTGRTSDPYYQITSLPLHSSLDGTTFPDLGMTPMDGTAGACRSWGFCFFRAPRAGSYAATAAPDLDFHAVLLPHSAWEPMISWPRRQNDQFSFMFSADPGARCQLEVSTNLTDWSPLGDPVITTNRFFDVTNTMSGPRQFFRFKTLP